MRVLVTGFGHIGPVLPVARALSAAGHDVRLATHASRHGLIAPAGVTAVSAGMTEMEMVAERPKRTPEAEGRPTVEWAYRMFAEIMAPVMRADLLLITASWQPDLVLHEEGEYSGPVVATELGVPWLTEFGGEVRFAPPRISAGSNRPRHHSGGKQGSTCSTSSRRPGYTPTP